MKPALILIFLAVILVSGCVASEGANNTTQRKIDLPSKRISKQTATNMLENLDAVEMFFQLHPEAESSLELTDCCGDSINYTGGCGLCDKTEKVWLATYSTDYKELVIGLDAETKALIGMMPKIEYLQSGKYCEKDSDCRNVGDENYAMCINKYYSTGPNEVPCDGTAIGCSGTMQCCYCNHNWCTMKRVYVTSKDCKMPVAGYTAVGEQGSMGSGSYSCSNLPEITEGQTITSKGTTLKFVAIYVSDGIYTVKIEGKSGNDTSIKYLKEGESDYVLGIKVSVTDISLAVSEQLSTATIFIEDLGGTCFVSL